jgi:hypothetical protein
MEEEPSPTVFDPETEDLLSRVVAATLIEYPPERYWPRSTRRALFAPKREYELSRVYEMGVWEGARAAQAFVDADPGRVGRLVEGYLATRRLPRPDLGTIPFTSSDFADGTEYMAACERFGGGMAIGWSQVLRHHVLPLLMDRLTSSSSDHPDR